MKNALPLLVGAAAVVALAGSKKKPSRSSKKTSYKYSFDDECSKWANELDWSRHNRWITARAIELHDDGMPAESIGLEILKADTPNCPWDDPSKWTPLMQDVHDQLQNAINLSLGQQAGS